MTILYSVTNGAAVVQDRVGKLGHCYESWPLGGRSCTWEVPGSTVRSDEACLWASPSPISLWVLRLTLYPKSVLLILAMIGAILELKSCSSISLIIALQWWPTVLCVLPSAWPSPKNKSCPVLIPATLPPCPSQLFPSSFHPSSLCLASSPLDTFHCCKG